MPWLGWIRRLFRRPPEAETPSEPASRPGVCPRCSRRLRSKLAQQCLACGASWHRIDGSAAISARRRLADLEVAGGEPANRITPAAARLLESVVGPELPPPRTFREALELGPLTPPMVRGSRRAARPHDQAVSASRSIKQTGSAIGNPVEETASAEAGSDSPGDRRRSRGAAGNYMGRGVSRRLAQRVSDVARLVEFELPELHTPEDVAAALEIDVRRLRWLCWHAAATTRPHYVAFEVPKRSGGMRLLAAPHDQLGRCQQWILRNILERVPAHDAAHGFVRGHSTVTNARPHVGQEVVVNADLKDFFPSITYPRVAGIFRSLGYSAAVASVLALLCTECPRRHVELDGRTWHVATGPRALPQGASTSPALSNLAARRLDRRLAGLTDKLGWRYTRYADDLTFSTSAAAGAMAYLLASVRRIAAEEDFALNEAKTRVLRQSTSQRVTGVVVNRRLGVPRKLVRRVRAILHQAQQTGLAAQDRDGRADFTRWLEGTVAYIAMVNPQQGAPLREALARVKSSGK